MRRTSTPVHTRGFSLVELMVGIVVAMAAIIVVMQVFRVSEGQRRTTTGGDDAQTTGAIAMIQLQRDLRQAGQGFNSDKILGCQVNMGGGRVLPSLVPLQINPANVPDGDDNTDTLLVSVGSGWGAPEGSRIDSQPSSNGYYVAAYAAYQVGDNVIATPQNQPTPCALDMTTVTGITPSSSTVTVALGMAGATNGALFNLGRAPRVMAYAVRSGRLTACDYMTQTCTSADPANWTEVAEGVVSMRVEYALDDNTYSQTLPVMLPSYCSWMRVVGVRFVLVVRNRQPETTDVTPNQPSWAGSAPVQMTDTDWKRYRYRTFETTVPLRNLSSSTLC